MKSTSQLHTYILVALILFAGTLSFLVIKAFFVPAALAAIIATALYPLYKWFLRITRGQIIISALLTEIIAIICVVTPIVLLGTQLASEAGRIAAYFSSPENASLIGGHIQNIATQLGAYVPGIPEYVARLSQQTSQIFQQIVDWAVNNSGYAFAQTLSLMLSLFLFILSLFYFLKDGSRLVPRLIHLSPLGAEETAQLTARIVATVNSIVRGNLTVALLQVIVSGIGFTIFGVPNALIWSICVGIASLAPGIGTPVFYFGATAYLLAVGSTIPGIGMLIWSVLAIIIVDNIIGPKLIGGKAELHPILVLISVLGGLSFFGPSGIFLGPLVISVLVGLLEIYAPEPRTSA